MKVTAVYGSGIGTHPCAGSGWKIRPETHMEQKVLKDVFGIYEDLNVKTMRYSYRCEVEEKYPKALTVKRLSGGKRRGDGEYEYFIHACTTEVVVNPHCAGSPKGKLEVLELFLRACAKLCANAKYTETPSAFTQV